MVPVCEVVGTPQKGFRDGRYFGQVHAAAGRMGYRRRETPPKRKPS